MSTAKEKTLRFKTLALKPVKGLSSRQQSNSVVGDWWGLRKERWAVL